MKQPSKEKSPKFGSQNIAKPRAISPNQVPQRCNERAEYHKIKERCKPNTPKILKIK